MTVALRNPGAASALAVPVLEPRRRRNSPAQSAALERVHELRRRVTHCPAGHKYAGTNLYVRPDGRRMCRRCRRNQAAILRAVKRARMAIGALTSD